MMVVMMLRATRRRHLPTPPLLSLRQRRHRPPSLPPFGPIRTEHPGNDSGRRGWSPREEGKYWEFGGQPAWGRGFVGERRAFVTPWRAGLADLKAMGSHFSCPRNFLLKTSLSAGLLWPEEKVSARSPLLEAAMEV